MPDIIGSTYEIVQQIGAGGGGIVYLARHQRLNKQVVLKADKRKITTRPELLRREVDVLKDLSHPYIPQVYDFFVEGETVYTALDFVDGESLDRPLKRQERFSQAQVIKWARQLLEALDYLHRPTHGDPPRGYVHSDIKPANIMLRMNGDICLIDFNISLALGEENIVGASAGYASPEHYGLDFSFSSHTSTQYDQTELMDRGTKTLPMPENHSASRQRIVVPDVRSDVYSIGATLYHLLSGRRPPKSAMDVAPLDGPGISEQVVAIITKAMNPNPDLRYQTAAEMLWDFEHLHENDPRTKKQKRQAAVTAAALSLMMLVGVTMTFVGLRQMQQAEQVARLEAQQAEAVERMEKQALEAVTDSENAYQLGDVPVAIQRAVEALEFDSPYLFRAQKALTDALGVYDLSSVLHPHQVVELPSEVLKLAISPEGTRFAALYAFQAVIIDSDTGKNWQIYRCSQLQHQICISSMKTPYSAQAWMAYALMTLTMLPSSGRERSRPGWPSQMTIAVLWA